MGLYKYVNFPGVITVSDSMLSVSCAMLMSKHDIDYAESNVEKHEQMKGNTAMHLWINGKQSIHTSETSVQMQKLCFLIGI